MNILYKETTFWLSALTGPPTRMILLGTTEFLHNTLLAYSFRKINFSKLYQPERTEGKSSQQYQLGIWPQFDLIETRAADAAFPQAWIFHFMFIHCKETTKNAYVFTFFKRTKFKALYFPLDLCDDVYKRNMKQLVCAFATISRLP